MTTRHTVTRVTYSFTWWKARSRCKVEGGELRTLKSGDTFYENPKDTHGVGRNVSKTKPAKLLVFFVKDQNAPLVLAPKR